MTYKEKFDQYSSRTDWLKRAKVIFLYHQARKKLNYKHRIDQTSSYFSVSPGYVSLSITIVNHYNEIKNCKSRDQAIKFIKLNHLGID